MLFRSQECYAALEGDYQGVLGRLTSERMVQKFVLKFLNDGSFDLLVRSMEEENYQEAFRAAHTIKGVCQNLDFTEINDIITYKVDNQYLVTHRIVEGNGNSFVTKGDNNNAIDNKKIAKESIEGKVIYKSNFLKLLYNHWIIVVLLIFCILIIC